MYDIIPDLQLSEIADFRALIALNFPLFLLGAPKYPSEITANFSIGYSKPFSTCP